jgi:carbamoyl-phosphate synthase large subunit
MPVNILLSSSGRRGELVNIFKQAISESGHSGAVLAADRSPLTAAGWLSDELFIAPDLRDPGFIDEVLAFCLSRNVTYIIPTIDTELPIYAAARDIFNANGIRVWVSAPDTIAIAQDKRATNRWLTANSFPAPRQIDLDEALGGSRLEFPMIAKPARGSSSVGLSTVHSLAHLGCLDRKMDYVLESIAPGREYTVDVLVDDQGRCRAAVPRRRLETRAGEVSKGVTVRDHELISLATAIAERLPGSFGVLNIQIFKDENTGELCVIEINARFGGGFPLTWAAGARYPTWLIQKLAGSTPSASLDWASGTLMLRYDAGLYRALGEEGESL